MLSYTVGYPNQEHQLSSAGMTLTTGRSYMDTGSQTHRPASNPNLASTLSTILGCD